ncbi:zinc ABC transporter substrate-binding protein [Marinobacter gelidimuriae]|uniref:zinc ABC transporter substrate-binding protein n=1 Tax=Marinobacter gelidimuriae TaxID=2739064 RepID=UPI00038167E1|nr:zinc ABC transporter substrate-binding protein [Marinobacter gelidimuriae]
MNTQLRLPRAAFMTGLITLAAALPAAAETNIVTSIKPLELLVRAVATDDVTVTSLVAPGGSPHNYTLRPSQRRALEQADAIFWVGPEVESFLTRLLANNEFSGRTHQLMGQTDNHSEEAPHADDDQSREHNDHHEHQTGEEKHNGHSDEHAQTDDEHNHDHGTGDDPHIWVDPQHALEMARAIAQTLSKLDSTNAQVIQQNLQAFEQRLNAREASIREQLEPLQNRKLFSYHSAFTRFAEHYGLQLQGVLTLNPALSPGAKHIAEVQNQLKQAGSACLLTEPQFNTQWWKSITEGLDITFSTWDPLATDIPATPEGYEQFQQSIADAVLNCR